MTAEKELENTDPIDDLALCGLEKSEEGLRLLMSNAGECSRNLITGRTAEGLDQLFSLVEHLRDFDVFEHSICLVFNIDQSACADNRGSLENNRGKFLKIMNSIPAQLETNNMAGLSKLLGTDLIRTLKRYKDLIPILRKLVYARFSSNEMVAKEATA